METKKKNNANLDRFKGIFLLTGLAISLGVMLFIFSWSSKAEAAADYTPNSVVEDEEMIISTKREVKPPPPPPPPSVAEIINIVDEPIINDEELEWDTEYEEGEEIEIVEINETEEPVENDFTHVIVEQMPKFPGGELALRKFIAKNINYPAISRENDVQGKVYVRFAVSKDGSVKKVSVVRGVDEDLDKEAIKVVKKLPKFEPGRMGNKPVSVWYTVPIHFKLS